VVSARRIGCFSGASTCESLIAASYPSTALISLGRSGSAFVLGSSPRLTTRSPPSTCRMICNAYGLQGGLTRMIISHLGEAAVHYALDPFVALHVVTQPYFQSFLLRDGRRDHVQDVRQCRQSDLPQVAAWASMSSRDIAYDAPTH
jgi:hypothetical protein